MLVLVTLVLKDFYNGQSDSVFSAINVLTVRIVSVFDVSDTLLKSVGHC